MKRTVLIPGFAMPTIFSRGGCSSVTCLALALLAALWLLAGVARPAAAFRPAMNSQRLMDWGEPFGMHGPFIETAGRSDASVVSSLQDIGVRWIRMISPELREKGRSLHNAGFRLYVGLRGGPERQIQQTVRQYKDIVKVWWVGNEPDFHGNMASYPQYLDTLQRAYRAVKAADPSALVATGGLAHGARMDSSNKSYQFLQWLLQNGGQQYFDILAFHHQGGHEAWADLKNTVALFKNLMQRYNCSKPMFVTEIATHDGAPSSSNPIIGPVSPQSEREQAAGMVKRYVYGRHLGIKVLFWNLLVERHNFANRADSYYNNVGLVHNPANDGKNHKKLAYYSYKMMTDTLEGVDWDAMTLQQTPTGAFVFTARSRIRQEPVYVIWGSGTEFTRVTLQVDPGKTVLAKPAVPGYQSGDEVWNYDLAFPESVITPAQRRGAPSQLVLEVDATPVYVTYAP